MPRRAEVIKNITKAARAAGLKFETAREGRRHTIYDLDGLMITIGRHTELGQRYAETIYKQCEPKLGKGWWR